MGNLKKRRNSARVPETEGRGASQSCGMVRWGRKKEAEYWQRVSGQSGIAGERWKGGVRSVEGAMDRVSGPSRVLIPRGAIPAAAQNESTH